MTFSAVFAAVLLSKVNVPCAVRLITDTFIAFFLLGIYIPGTIGMVHSWGWGWRYNRGVVVLGTYGTIFLLLNL